MRYLNELKKARWLSSFLFLIALFLVTGMVNPDFLTYSNIITCFNGSVVFALLAIGIAFVIMTGEIDVSIGAVMGLTATMAGQIAKRNGNILEMLVFAVLVGMLVGAMNGIGVSLFRVPSLIFTLGVNGALRGLIYIVSGGKTTENFAGAFTKIGNQVLFAEVTIYLAIIVVIIVVIHLLLTKTKKGKYFIAVGDNSNGAKCSPMLSAVFLRGLQELFLLPNTDRSISWLEPAMRCLRLQHVYWEEYHSPEDLEIYWVLLSAQ